MKFRIIIDNIEPEITIVTEDGGIACIRQADDIGPEPSDKRIAVSDYYDTRITQLEGANRDNLFERLSDEATIYHDDWPDTPYNDLHAINTALSWLAPHETQWVLVDDIFTDFL